MGDYYTCAYCHGSGENPHDNDPCRACGGSGKMLITYDNAVKCAYCHGSGENPHDNKPCKVCQGAGYTKPGIQL
jgi:DnaJ-class molecular chaperone